jgi:hypothetical protein
MDAPLTHYNFLTEQMKSSGVLVENVIILDGLWQLSVVSFSLPTYYEWQLLAVLARPLPILLLWQQLYESGVLPMYVRQ